MSATFFNVEFTNVYFIFRFHSFLYLFLHNVLILHVLFLGTRCVFKLLPTFFRVWKICWWNAFRCCSHIGLIFVERVFYVDKIGVAILEQVYCLCPMRLTIFRCKVCIKMTRLSLRIIPCNTVAFRHRLGDSRFCRSGISMQAIWILPYNHHTIFHLVEESSCKKPLLLLCFISVFSVFIILFCFYLLTNVLLILMSKMTFLCYSLYSSSSECVCTHIHTRHTLHLLFLSAYNLLQITGHSLCYFL